MSKARNAWFVLIAAIWGAGLSGTVSAESKYTVFRVGTARTTLPGAINSFGEVAGRYLEHLAKPPVICFIRVQDGAITTFMPNGDATNCEVTGINDVGTVAGSFNLKCCLEAYLRDAGGTFTIFGVPGSSYTRLTALNSLGEVAGDYITDHQYGLLRAPDGTLTTFAVAGSTLTEVTGLNDKGEIVGWYFDGAGVAHGFIRFPKGGFAKFDVPGAGDQATQGTFPQCINNRDITAGTYADTNGVRHGFIRTRDGSVSEFAAPDGGTGNFQGTYVQGINNKNVVMGTYNDNANVQHSFIRTAGGVLTEFDVPRQSLLGTFAAGINDSGEIVGSFETGKSYSHSRDTGFLRTP